MKLRLVRLKEGLINLCELEGRQGFVSQAVLGRGDPLCLLAEGKYCTRKSKPRSFKTRIVLVYFLI